MTLLIATDEAGYGPKLGPLVIAATAWQIDLRPGVESETPDACANSDQDARDLAFAKLRQPVRCDETNVVVDDSKVVFSRKNGLGPLHSAFSACLNWCGIDASTLVEALKVVAPESTESLASTPWLSMPDMAVLPPSSTDAVVQSWSGGGAELLDLRLNLITADRFNGIIDRGYNKADLLSEVTLNLVRQLVDRHASSHSDGRTEVFCDRHGGRRYYAAVLQHAFPDRSLAIVSETKSESRYRLGGDDSSITIRFSVKGDSFAPVALSSMIAKYVRERAMEALNRYFADRYTGAKPLRETAGYPVDADRYLSDIASVIEKEQIPLPRLVRSR